VMRNKWKASGAMIAFACLSLLLLPFATEQIEALPYEEHQIAALKKFLGYLYMFCFFVVVAYWVKLNNKDKS